MLTDVIGTLDPRLAQLEQMRTRTPMWDAVIDEQHGRRIRIGDDWLVDWASCNYLGLDLDPEVIMEVASQVARWGTHPGWSRMLGSPRQYVDIEERLTDLLGAPDTLVLPTISQIHVAVMPVLAAQGTVFVESLAHKTIYDGAVHARALGATMQRFRSGDLTRLEELLREAPAGPRLVCLDGVNSMTGNLPDLPAYAALGQEHGALLYVDDAHGFGVIGERRPDESSPYGARGNGIVRHLGLDYDGLVLVGGFSKAYSSLLAFLTVPTAVKSHLKVTAPTYLYSGPSPFASLASVLAGMDVNERRGEDLRGYLYRLSRRLLDHIDTLGVVTLNTDGTPIVELPIAPDRDLVDVAAELWRRGLFVTLAPYPGVPRDLVGFRIQLTAAHTEEQLEHLIAVLSDLAADGTLRARTP
ncbi:MAG TPA: pyridoxal phosphate-dependent aminotransferase family protein [Jiangellales bacterium]|nr:pyridoxal phosphate-dependent aminotransferase family protein [Jiangellales bacterium]